MDEKKIKALYSDFNKKIILNCICGGSIYNYFSLDKSDSHNLHLNWIVIHPSLSLKKLISQVQRFLVVICRAIK